MLQFSHPAALLLLPLALLPYWLRRQRGSAPIRHPSDTSATRLLRSLLTHGFLRAATIALLGLALAGPGCVRRSDRLSVAVLLDVSASVAPSFLDETFARLDGFAAGLASEVQWIAFADRPFESDSAEALRAVPVARAGESLAGDTGLDRQFTDLEAAVELALDRIDPRQVPRLLLISDGLENRGSLARLQPALIEREARLFALAAPVALPSQMTIQRIEAVTPPRAGGPVPVQLDVDSPTDRRAVLELRVDGEAVQTREVELVAGTTTFTVEIRFEDQGVRELSATLSSVAGDSEQEIDDVTLTTGIQVEPPLRIAHVEGEPSRAHYYGDALRRAGFEVERLLPSQLPTEVSAYRRWDALVLSDVPPEPLAGPRGEAIERWVRELGGGLLFASGETTYGEDGFSESIIERALPVKFEVKEEESDVALMITLDKSYSMRGDKIELAKAASIAALEVLDDQHKYGLIAFDWNPTLVVPLQQADQREAIKEQIGRIEATAQTNFFPALEMAFGRLREVDSKTKHVILLSDGKTYPDDYERLLADMRDEGITVSTVAVGDEADRELLEAIAQWGGGRSYFIADARRVVGVLVEEAQKTVKDTLVEDDTAVLTGAASPVLAGIDLSQVPPLRGHVAATARARAELWLVTDEDDPLLASWPYGLGRTTMFAGDLKNRWSSEWISWPGWSPLWAQVTRDLAARRTRREVDFTLVRHGDTLIAELSAVDETGSLQNALTPRLRGPSEVRELAPTAPGLYRLELPIQPSPHAQRYELEVGGELLARRWITYPVPDELRYQPPDLDLLRSVAESSGGTLIEDPSAVLADLDDRRGSVVALWPLAALLALLGFLAELLLRRRSLVPSAASQTTES